MKYSYRALNLEGCVVTGEIESADSRSATREITRQGMTPVEVVQATKATKRGFQARGIKAEDRLLLMQQLSTLLASGIPLDEAVSSLEESSSHPLLEQSLNQMSTQLRRGDAFSTVLQEADLGLPAYMYRLAEAGEMTGQLARALAEGSRQMQYDLRLRNEMRNALVYPAILVLSGIAAVILIFTLVVPKFASLLDKAQTDIPFLASAVLNTGKFFNDNIIAVLLVAVSLVMAGIVTMRKPAGRQRLLDFLMRQPLIGGWLREADIGRWSSLLATLLKSKVELIQALELARLGVSSSRLKSNLYQVARAVQGGKRLADALKEAGAITATGYGLVKVGERSGELPGMLQSLAAMYEESGRNRMKRFLALLEPVAILVIGAVIGLIMTGIILAITSVNDISF